VSGLLIVDDEDILRGGLRVMIDDFGLAISPVWEAENGLKALEVAAKKQPGIILLDIRMPYMDGVEALKAMRERGFESRVIMLSGYGDFEYTKQAIKYRAFDYLLKPVKREELKKALTDALACPEPPVHPVLLAGEAGSSANLGPNNPDGAESNSRKKVISIAKRFILNNYNKDINLDMIANHVSMNFAYFSVLFKKIEGMSLTDFIASVRVNKAKEYLLQPRNYKIYEIAEMTGFHDVKYFSKVFKRKVGVTPAEYREKGVSVTVKEVIR